MNRNWIVAMVLSTVLAAAATPWLAPQGPDAARRVAAEPPPPTSHGRHVDGPIRRSHSMYRASRGH
jgi:hypothetical protein